MKVSFLDFWPGFNPRKNFFIDCLKSGFEQVKVVPERKADFVIYSLFGIKHKNISVPKIIYIGEHISYKNFNADYSFSFEPTSSDKRNFNLPLWMMQLKWFKQSSYGNPNYLCDIDSLMHPNGHVENRKIHLMGIFNHDNCENRLKIMSRLMKLGPTRFYGLPFGNHFRGRDRSKIKVLKNSKFNLCFENGNSPGYHTEKLIHAKIVGCIPIYWANRSSTEETFNQQGFLFISDTENEESIINLMEKMQNTSLIRTIAETSIFKEKPTLDPFMKHLMYIKSKLL